MRSAILPWLLVLGAAAGCGSSSTGAPSGTQGGPCYPNGTCNNGLFCVETQCSTEPPWPDGAEGPNEGGGGNLVLVLTDTRCVVLPVDPYEVTGYGFAETVGASSHVGQDVHAPAGTEVRAAADGEIIYAHNHSPTVNDGKVKGNWGGLVLMTVTIGGTTVTLVYGHLDPDHLPPLGKVKKGDRIGQIATKAQTGYDPHLHMQVSTTQLGAAVVPGYASSTEGWQAFSDWATNAPTGCNLGPETRLVATDGVQVFIGSYGAWGYAVGIADLRNNSVRVRGLHAPVDSSQAVADLPTRMAPLQDVNSMAGRSPTAVLALNSAAYGPDDGIVVLNPFSQWWPTSSLMVEGQWMSWSAPEAVLEIRPGSASIQRSLSSDVGPPQDDTVQNAVGSNVIVMESGNLASSTATGGGYSDNLQNARSAAGVDSTGRYLILFASEGTLGVLGSPDAGLTRPQVYEILRVARELTPGVNVVATDAILLDGGHATQMFIYDGGVLKGLVKPKPIPLSPYGVVAGLSVESKPDGSGGTGGSAGGAGGTGGFTTGGAGGTGGTGTGGTGGSGGSGGSGTGGTGGSGGTGAGGTGGTCSTNFCQNFGYGSGSYCDGTDSVACYMSGGCPTESSRSYCQYGCSGGSCQACSIDCFGKCGGASDTCGGYCYNTCPTGYDCPSGICTVCGGPNQHCCDGTSCSSGLNCTSGTCQALACTDTYLTSAPSSCFDNPGTSGTPTICIEVRQVSGPAWEWRACKPTGQTFGTNFSYVLHDYNHSAFSSTYQGSGGQCTPWQTTSLTYLPGYGAVNGAGLAVDIKSPSSCTTSACQYKSGEVTIRLECL